MESWDGYDFMFQMYMSRCPRKEIPKMSSMADKCYLATKQWTSCNIWHFIYSCAAEVFAMEQSGYTGCYMVFDSIYARTFLKYFGITDDRIIWIHEEDEGRVFYFKEIYCMHTLSDSKRATVIHDMAQVVKKMVNNSDVVDYPKKVFWKRIGRRKMLGAEEILDKYGFVTIIPEDLSIEEQINYFSHADIVICPHGAGSVYSMFMEKNSMFIECFGFHHVCLCNLGPIEQGGIKYRQLVEEGTTDRGIHERIDGGYLDYTIRPQLLEMVLNN